MIRAARAALALWRRSLQLRTITITLVLSAAVIALVGFLLLNQVADGIVRAKERSSLDEAYGGFATAQTRLESLDAGGSAVGVLIGQVVGDLSSRSGSAAPFEIVVTGSLGPQDQSTRQFAPRFSGQVDPASVPDTLRRVVSTTADAQYTFAPISYVDGRSAQAGLVVGKRLFAPGSGYYEMYYLFELSQEQDALALVQRTLYTAGGLLLGLIGIIAWFVVRQTVRPVRQAARIAERLADGYLQERMITAGTDEHARLAASFNAMATSLERQISQLEDLSRLQRRFVSDVSHELRTPLTTVRMAADVLHDARPAFDPAVARSAELLHHELDRFESLLTDLLEISRFDAGAAVLETESVDIGTLAAEVAESMVTLAAVHATTVTVTARDGAAFAEVDPRRVERILRNLISNAIEHSEGKPVEVTTGTSEAAVAVTVRDHGLGLRPGDAARVFDRFWRADPARARTTGGTGLGLSIALEDAQLHGGWLQAWGKPGRGSVFRLTIPRILGAELDASPLALVPHDSAPALPVGSLARTTDFADRVASEAESARAGSDPVRVDARSGATGEGS